MKKLIPPFTVVVLCGLVAVTSGLRVYAATLEDVNIPDQATVGGKKLMLNGLGLRTATMLKVKVYVVGLYLESKSGDAEAIIASPGPKRVALHFVRDVGADKLRDGWQEAFENNWDNVDDIKVEIDKFNASMRDVEEGDVIALDLAADSVDVTLNGEKIDSISGAEFQKATLSIWLGREPPNEDLKKGLLGGQ